MPAFRISIYVKPVTLNEGLSNFALLLIKQSIGDLRLNFSHLNEHNFRHNFSDTVDPMRTCCREPETTLHTSCAVIYGSEDFNCNMNKG